MTKKREPLVAIAIPVYNGEKYIAECIEHILAQTYENWICYISNNASTDNTVSIIEKYIRDDARFKLFHTSETIFSLENFNLVCSYFANTDAKYLWVNGVDDWLFPECIERMVEILELDDKIGLAASFYMQMDDTCRGTVMGRGLDVYDGNVYDGKDIIYFEAFYFRKNCLTINGTLLQMYRIEAIKKCISPSLHIFEIIPKVNYDFPMMGIEGMFTFKMLENYKLGFVYQVLFYRGGEGYGGSYLKKYGVNFFNAEKFLYEAMRLFPDSSKIKENYKKIRVLYAASLLLAKLRGNNNIVKWHRDHLKCPIKLSEFLMLPFHCLYLLKIGSGMIKRKRQKKLHESFILKNPKN